MDPSPPNSAFSWRAVFGPAAAGDPQATAQRVRLVLGVLLVLVIGAGVIVAGDKFLGDPDTLWHITVGGDIWRTKSFPHVDAYSHTFAGQPWIAKEWLSQIILFGLYSLGGWNAVVVACIAIMCVVLVQIYWMLSGLLKPTFAAAGAAAIMALSSTVFLARPHVLVLPIVLWFVFGVWGAAQRGKAPSWWLLVAMCVWSNMHGSFTFGYIVAGLAFLYYLHAFRSFRSPTTWRWLIFLALCPVASIVHPYGFEAIWSTIVIAKSEALPYIIEWRPFDAGRDRLPEAALLIILATLATTRLRLDIVSTLFICLLAHMYLLHVRFVYLFFMIAPVLLAWAAAKQFPQISYANWAEAAGGDAVERFLSKRAKVLIPAVVAIWLTILSLVGIQASFAPSKYFPAAAIEAARDHGVTGNVINYYGFGGALIFERVPTFVDGRADRLFQGGFMKDIDKTRYAGYQDLYEEMLDKYDIGWSIYPPGDVWPKILDTLPGWERIYEDDLAVVHARKKTGE